jgi:hypothetical protein
VNVARLDEVRANLVMARDSLLSLATSAKSD